MTATDIVAMLRDLIENAEEGTEAVRSVETFAEAGLLTRDEGVVLQTHEGEEFQITVIRSR